MELKITSEFVSICVKSINESKASLVQSLSSLGFNIVLNKAEFDAVL